MDKILCEKCGHEVEKGSVICMYCGKKIATSVSDAEVDSIANKPTTGINVAPKKTSSNDTEIAIRTLGNFLIGAGIFSDVLAMFMVGSSSIESFKYIGIFGTISFLIGLVLRYTGASG